MKEMIAPWCSTHLECVLEICSVSELLCCRYQHREV